MKPIKFKEANKNLSKPDSMTEEECGSLWVFNDGKQCISCWKMSFWQRIKALLFGRETIMYPQFIQITPHALMTRFEFESGLYYRDKLGRYRQIWSTHVKVTIRHGDKTKHFDIYEN